MTVSEFQNNIQTFVNRDKDSDRNVEVTQKLLNHAEPNYDILNANKVEREREGAQREGGEMEKDGEARGGDFGIYEKELHRRDRVAFFSLFLSRGLTGQNAAERTIDPLSLSVSLTLPRAAATLDRISRACAPISIN